MVIVCLHRQNVSEIHNVKTIMAYNIYVLNYVAGDLHITIFDFGICVDQ